MPHQSDPAKREQWLEEMAARPEIAAGDLLGVFNNPDFVRRVDEEQKRLQKESVARLVGFSALEGATKDETRILQMARSNMALYDDEIEDVIYEDPVMSSLIEEDVRNKYKSDEMYSQAVRLRRTIVAFYVVYDEFMNSEDSPAASAQQRPA